MNVENIKNFCEKSIQIANDEKSAFQRGIKHQAIMTLELVKELEKIDKIKENINASPNIQE
jgi:hypothetical protein